MNGEADNSHFVRMHVYMHLAFKELKSIVFLKLCFLNRFNNLFEIITRDLT